MKLLAMQLRLVACTAAMVTAFWGFGTMSLPAAPAAAASSAATAAYQPPGTPDPSVAGATTPFATYWAPAGALGGGASMVSLTSAPTSQYDSPEGEAEGHAYVQLTGTGQSVQWTNDTGQPISFINVRASIPDSSSGGGITATLDLYVNGTFRQALNMNSIQSWQYEGNNNYSGNDQNPADGDPRDFWDEFHAFISGSPIPAGATFSLVKDSSNTAQFYRINSVDVWNVPAPLAQPANSISIASCGAVADNTPTNGTAAPGATDSTAAIQNCVSQAQSLGKILWIPQGTFYLVGTAGIVVNGVTVEGAGYLYSEIYRDVPLPNNTPLGAAFQCYSCQLQNNFFTSIWADGCNLNNVALTGTSGSNLTATNNFIRGTGDDGMAINSVAYNGSQTYTAMTNITMTHNTVIAPWSGKGIGIYGGSGHHVQNNYLADTARYIGLGVGRFGVNGSDMTGATVSGNTITNPWRNGIVIAPPFYPAPSGNASITGSSVTGVTSGHSAFINNSSGFTATLSGNSWQSGSTEGPYGGTPAAVPGTVQAANYDTGGQGVAYNVTSVNGTANSYRRTGPTWRTAPTQAAVLTSAGPPRASGSGTRSTPPRLGTTRSASGSHPPAA